MSGLKNSPFGKRLRATQQDPDEEGPRRSRPRTNPIFGVAPASTPSLDSSRPSTSESTGPESPTELHRPNKDYGDRFVPSRDAGDLRTSYNLMEESGPSTPSRNRIIPSESDSAKGEHLFPPLFNPERHPAHPNSNQRRWLGPSSLPPSSSFHYSLTSTFAAVIPVFFSPFAGNDGPSSPNPHVHFRTQVNFFFLPVFPCG
jgi:cell division cycle 20-like protein 1, cofactor of APC complex